MLPEPTECTCHRTFGPDDPTGGTLHRCESCIVCERRRARAAEVAAREPRMGRSPKPQPKRPLNRRERRAAKAKAKRLRRHANRYVGKLPT